MGSFVAQSEYINEDGRYRNEIGVDHVLVDMGAVQAYGFFKDHPEQTHGHKYQGPLDFDSKFIHLY